MSEGSDTTLFVMQAISDLYAQAGISPFSCSIAATANSVCVQPTVSTPNPNNTQSDETDNFSGTQELQGTNDVVPATASPSCAAAPSAPAGTTVDYSRSSKPMSTSTCPTGVELGFAKDAVAAVDFQTINPGLYGTPNGYLSQTDPQCTQRRGLLPELRRLERGSDLHQVPGGGNRTGGRWLAADRPHQLRYGWRSGLFGNAVHEHLQHGHQRWQRRDLRRLPALLPARPERHGRRPARSRTGAS